MKETLIKLAPDLMVVLTPLFMAVVGWLSFQLTRLINAHVTSSNYKTAALKITDLATTKVKALAQTVVADAKNPDTPGTFDAAHARRVKQMAVDSVMASLGDAKKIARDLGVAEFERLRERVADSIEAAVLDSKAKPVGEALLIEPGTMADEVTR